MSRLRNFRNRLARLGIVGHRRAFSRSVWGVTRADLMGRVEPAHGLDPGCDAWPIHVVLEALEAGRPLGYAHYNEGECRCLIGGRHKNRDRVQICTEASRHLVAESLRTLATTGDHRVRERFVVGLPCPRCHGAKATDVLRIFPGLERVPRVLATIFHHAFPWARERMAAALRARGGEVHLVCSPEHDVGAIESLLGLRLSGVLRVDRLRAHDDPGAFGAWCREIGWGEHGPEAPPRTLLLICGIMGRPWAVDAFTADPESVTMCLGSYFDDVALGRMVHYARGGAIRCGRCLRPGG